MWGLCLCLCLCRIPQGGDGESEKGSNANLCMMGLFWEGALVLVLLRT